MTELTRSVVAVEGTAHRTPHVIRHALDGDDGPGQLWH